MEEEKIIKLNKNNKNIQTMPNLLILLC